ncbi:MAG: SppA protein [Bacteroidota bacterium]|nr:SppA protein [Bacteroidota bacterium]
MPDSDATIELSDQETAQLWDPDVVVARANTVAKSRDADVFLFNGLIRRVNAERLRVVSEGRSKRKNVILILTTFGGDADAAYIIARHLQSNYEQFSVFVTGCCKSAGTLLALGAHELIMTDQGELGPLDVQLSKKDELGETQSGLVVLDALVQLQQRAFDSFEDFFVKTKFKSGLTLTSQTCAKIATELTNGLFTPIYGQIDPLHLGEAGRAMNVAQKYGERLIHAGRNISMDKVYYLASNYPSHGFVIDRAEARDLFKQVSNPSNLEQDLAVSLGDVARVPILDPYFMIKYLSDERQQEQDVPA